MKVDKNILRKIRALLARADADRNDNVHEREIAMRQAQKLMDQHAVSLASMEVMGEEIDDPRGRDGMKTGSRAWQRTVVHAIASLYGCDCYYTPGRHGQTMVIGRESARLSALSIAQYVCTSIEREGGRIARNMAEGSRAFGVSFRKGAAAGVWKQVKEIKAEREKESRKTVAGSTALVVVNHYSREMEANKEWTKENVGGMKKSKAAAASDAGGYYAGKEFGGKVNLERQIGGSTQGRIS